MLIVMVGGYDEEYELIASLVSKIMMFFLLKLVKILMLLTTRLGSYSRDEFLLDESL